MNAPVLQEGWHRMSTDVGENYSWAIPLIRRAKGSCADMLTTTTVAHIPPPNIGTVFSER